jgi:hypothetical protein
VSQIIHSASIIPAGTVATVTGNAGGAVGPDGVGNINITGTNDITVTGNPGTNSLGLAITGTTDHAVQIGDATGGIESIAVGTNGQVLLAATAADPAFATLTSSGGTITFTPGANTLNLEAVPGAIPASYSNSFPTDVGTATPAAHTLTVAGGTNLNSAGAGSTVTLNLDTALTGIVSVTGANGASLQTGTTAADTFLLQAYDVDGTTYIPFATLTSNNTPTMNLDTAVTIDSSYIYRAGGTDVAVADGGTGASTLTDHGILVGSGVNAITPITLTDGQLLIGSTGNDPVAASLTAGANITITPGAGTISIAAATIDAVWSIVTVNAGLVVNTGTIANKAGLLTMTLPATAAIGNMLEFTNMNTAVGIRIAQNANQYIRYGTSLSTTGVGGYLESTQLGDSLKLICVVAGASTGWQAVTGSIGNWTVA